MGEPFTTAFNVHLGQADRASGSRSGHELLLPLTSCFLSAAPKEGLRRKETRRSSATSEHVSLGHLEKVTVHQR